MTKDTCSEEQERSAGSAEDAKLGIDAKGKDHSRLRTVEERDDEDTSPPVIPYHHHKECVTAPDPEKAAPSLVEGSDDEENGKESAKNKKPKLALATGLPFVPREESQGHQSSSGGLQDPEEAGNEIASGASVSTASDGEGHGDDEISILEASVRQEAPQHDVSVTGELFEEPPLAGAVVERWKRDVLLAVTLFIIIGLVLGLILGLRRDDTTTSSSSPVPTSAPVPPPIAANWTQLGEDLVGEADDDYFGVSVAMSDTGDIVAIGGPRNDGNGINTGHVRVFQWNGLTWERLGADIMGEMQEDGFGFSVALSSNGTILAVGAPWSDAAEAGNSNRGQVRVYRFSVDEDWVQIGSSLNGDVAYDWFGFSVSLSSDGTALVVGATQTEANGDPPGYARVFQLAGEDWIRLGSDLCGDSAADQFGLSVALSSDGTVLAVGAPGDLFNSDTPGYVRTFRWDQQDWDQFGSSIVGEADGDLFGRAVVLSSDNSLLAVGAPFNDANGPLSGRAYVYQLREEDWIQLGSDMNGDNPGDNFGASVTLSSNGTVVAVGGRNAGGLLSGFVRMYRLLLSSDDWAQLGGDINGKEQGDEFGFSVAISADGKTVMGGAWQGYKSGDNNPGYARVYHLEK